MFVVLKGALSEGGVSGFWPHAQSGCHAPDPPLARVNSDSSGSESRVH